MGAWVNRTLLSGSSVTANGTTSHTCTFTAATSGNFLVAVVAGSVTFTTPTGWTLLISAVNNSAGYVFTRTATSGLSSFATTHNASNYAIEGVVYEYASGTASVGTPASNTAIGSTGSATGPACSSLTGTYTRFAARQWDCNATTGTENATWTLPTVEDQDQLTLKGTNDGITQTIAYDDGQTGTSFTPSCSISQPGSLSGEGVSFALTVVAGGGAATIPNIFMAPMIGA